MIDINYKNYTILKNCVDNKDYIKLVYLIKNSKFNNSYLFKKVISRVNLILSIDLSKFYTTKLNIINSKLFICIVITNHFIGYKHFYNIINLNNNIYFFNINKLIFILTQFSIFLYKIIYLRGQILLINLSPNFSNEVKIISYLTNQYNLVTKWIFGLWTNWSYFYKKLWEYENLVLKSIQFNKNIKKIIKKNYFGLLGLRCLPDFIFFFNNMDLFSYANIVKESYNFNIPMGGILKLFSDQRFLIFPLYGDMSNIFTNNFYKLLYIKLVKLGILKRYLTFKLINKGDIV